MERIVVIGTGFIGGYMTKGLKALTGASFSENVIGVKKHSDGAKKRSAELGFPIYSKPVPDVLSEQKPSVILLCPSPSAVFDIVKNAIAPYYACLRRTGEKLPELLSFAPSPSVDIISELIGIDAECVKLLPNVYDNVKGIDITSIGMNYITPVSGRQLSERMQMLTDTLLSPYGETITVNNDDSLVLLSGKITSHVCCELSYTIYDACRSLGLAPNLNAIGDCLRLSQHRLFPELPFISPCGFSSEGILSKEFYYKLISAWFDGLHSFTKSMVTELSEAEALYADKLAFLLNVFPISFETRDELYVDTNNAATKGGVLERGMEYFYDNIEKRFAECILSEACGKPAEPEFFSWLSLQAEEISRAAYERSCMLATK